MHLHPKIDFVDPTQRSQRLDSLINFLTFSFSSENILTTSVGVYTKLSQEAGIAITPSVPKHEGCKFV